MTRYLSSARGRAAARDGAAQPEFVFYLAGADPFEGDQLGGLRRQQGRAAPSAIGSSLRAAATPAFRS